MRHVAELAQVSPSTVSRVLNGSPLVRGDYRRRVLAAVAQIDYRPNRLARNLRLQKSETIGVVVPDIENPHFSEMVRVCEDSAFSAGYRVLLCNTDETPEKQRAYLETLADERVLGAIVTPADSRGVGLESLLELGIPIVAFDRVIDDPRADAVICDNVDSTRRATEHLIWLGHERIALIGGRPDVETGAERLEGYVAAMRAVGLTPFSVNGGFRTDVAEREVQTLLAMPTRPSALVVANNLMTIGALRAIKQTGLRIPLDLALVSIDDPPWAELIDPPLTVVAQPVRRMAETAIQLLLQRIHGRLGEPVRVVLPLDLRVRSSCGMRLSTANQRRG
ncbi:MAG: LacI family DNA-binding transcriptional regulator [Candidatus Krumholzibacteriia bacterium]